MEGKQQAGGGGGHATVAADYAGSLAPGYRFSPTDSELIVYYLKPKIEKQIHPRFARFHDVNIYDYHPKELAAKYAGCEDKWYFLTRRQPKYANGKRPNRQTKDEGTWRASQCYTDVEDSNGGVVGFKRSLAYFEHHVKKTDWLMHEYTITDENKMNDCALYKIYKKETKKNQRVASSAIQEDQSNNTTRNDYAVQQVAEEQQHEEPSPTKRRRLLSQGRNYCPLQETNNQPQQQQVAHDQLMDTTSTITMSSALTADHDQPLFPPPAVAAAQVVDDDIDELLAQLYKDYDKNNIHSVIMLEEVVQPDEEALLYKEYDYNTTNNNCLLQENNNQPQQAADQFIDTTSTTASVLTADHKVGDEDDVMDELLAQLYKDHDDTTIDNDIYYNINSLSTEEVLVQPTQEEEAKDNDGFDEIEALLYNEDDAVVTDTMEEEVPPEEAKDNNGFDEIEALLYNDDDAAVNDTMVEEVPPEEDDGFDEIEALLYNDDDDQAEDHQNIGHKQYDSMPAADEEDNYDEDEVAQFMKMLTYCSR